ncbi:sigma factor-like helix-turn-helix DNA-binding protein [Sphingopyxis panaciterrae]
MLIAARAARQRTSLAHPLPRFAGCAAATPRIPRRIFLMHRLIGMSYRAISDQLGVGDEGVEYHTMQALAAILASIVRALISKVFG